MSKISVERIIAYYRVSTKKQGRSGLGLKAQRLAVEEFAKRNGAKIVAEYVEVETSTGKRNRPKMQEAIAHARLSKATLVIAEIKRLARNVAFVSTLMESGISFVCCDNPSANTLTIHIMAAVAQDEARYISQKTREVMAVLKAKGVKLGSARPGHWKGREHLRGWKKGAKNSAKARTERANQAYAFLVPKMQELLAEAEAKSQDMQQLAEAAAQEVKTLMAPRVKAAELRARSGSAEDIRALDDLLEARRQAQKEARKPFSYPVYQKVAERLNAMGHQSTTGAPFNSPTVFRILQRARGEKPTRHPKRAKERKSRELVEV